MEYAQNDTLIHTRVMGVMLIPDAKKLSRFPTRIKAKTLSSKYV